MKLAKGKALVLRTCSATMTSHGGFTWPGVGGVAKAPDWNSTPECGNGLHGWLYGQGDHICSSYLAADSKWLVVEIDEASIIMLGGKCKFPEGKVVFVGDKKGATAFIIEHELRARNVAVIGAKIDVGDQEVSLVGSLGTATAGNRGTATAGHRGTATAGESGTATAGESGEIRIQYWDDKKNRYRTVIGYVGEDGIEADVAYVLDANHKLTKKDQ